MSRKFINGIFYSVTGTSIIVCFTALLFLFGVFFGMGFLQLAGNLFQQVPQTSELMEEFFIK
jgi:hypothetical protein